LELLRANERTAKADPQQALQEVAELVAARGRHPQLLARLAVLERQLRRPQAIHTAKDAAQLACSMGTHGAVAELLEPFRTQLDELALSADDWVKVAHAQKALKHLDQASALYQQVLSAVPRNLAAIKGLVQIADEHLKQDAAEQALAVYDYLDGQCADHPFREFTDRGREQAERKLLSTH
jgi:tetratricopeptide (TPR) repeat protein